jgi:uncharacterized delta-60 repeat protein/uncharacterized protein (TIGR02145 family)
MTYFLAIKKTVVPCTEFYFKPDMKSTKIRIQLTVLLASVFFLKTSLSQPGSNDPTFNITNNCDFGDASRFNNIVRSTLIQADGKIISGGTFTAYNGTVSNRIARINTDGSIDPTFNTGLGFDNDVFSIALQGDGKIIVGGNFTSFNGVTINRVARLHADGTLDTSFNPGSGLNNSVFSLAVQTDGKILVGGLFTTINGSTRNRIVRLNSDGSIDTTFVIGTGFNNTVNSLIVQSDGKILVGGSFSSFNGTTTNRIARINSDGSIDSAFSPGTFNNDVYTMAIHTDGKILVGGLFTTFNFNTVNRFVRLNANGTQDFSFNSGSAFDNSVRSISIKSNGKIIVGGDFLSFQGTSRFRAAGLNADGSLDTSFDAGLIGGRVWSSAVQADGKIILCGEFSSQNNIVKNRINRLNSDGTSDILFNPSTGFDNIVNHVLVQPNGKILVGGSFSTFNGEIRHKLARLNADGTLDPSFNVGTGFTTSVHTMAIQTDGKILVGGFFTTFNGASKNRIVRLNTDGSLDESFVVGTGFNNLVASIAIQTDGKIVVGGAFTTYKGVTANRIARLNTDGSLDNSFNTGTGFSATVQSVSIQSDGRIIAGGSFVTFNGTSRNRIARLNSNGTLHTTFNPGTGFNSTVYTTAIQSDGKIIAGGNFTTFGSATRNRIIRLTATGGNDATFNAGTGFNTFVLATAIQPDGQIIVGGEFTSFNGAAANHLTRLNTNGSLDNTFNSGGLGLNKVANSVAFIGTGKIIVGGDFTTYNDACRNRIAQIFTNSCQPISGVHEVNACVPYTWIDGVTYTASNNTATHLLVGAAQNGCDSLVTLNLTAIQPSSSGINATIIQGQSYLFNNQSLTSAGTYNMTLQNAAGCDSIVTLTLSVVPALQYELTASNTQICAGDEVELAVTLLGANYPVGYVHCNPNNPTAVVDVTNPTTGKTWMDRNLGANRAAISSTDVEAYGSLFQWGRFADGHQCVNRYAGDGVTTSSTTTTVSSSATPGHDDFIAASYAQWQMPVLNNLWQGVHGINNPCPEGYRLPTQSELEAERLSWQQAPINSTNNIAGGFASPLKFSMGGRRNDSDGGLSSVGSYGAYWSSTALAWEEISMDLIIGLAFPASVEWNHNRSMAVSVRCIKN